MRIVQRLISLVKILSISGVWGFSPTNPFPIFWSVNFSTKFTLQSVSMVILLKNVIINRELFKENS